MRESRWRSLARPTLIASALAAALSAVGACTPRLATEGLTGRCDPPSYMCQATGICMPPAAPQTTSNDGGSADAGSAICPMALNPRQGGSVLIPVPFARPEDVTAEAPDGLVIRPIVRDANDQVNVELFVPDATPLGDDSFRRIVTITTTIA